YLRHVWPALQLVPSRGAGNPTVYRAAALRILCDTAHVPRRVARSPVVSLRTDRSHVATGGVRQKTHHTLFRWQHFRPARRAGILQFGVTTSGTDGAHFEVRLAGAQCRPAWMDREILCASPALGAGSARSADRPGEYAGARS